ncbi:MAG TPA: SDR family oxidoreductase [Solirubrobacteraceae bacterium]|jgi:NAD(P)-dependent dehydrogenase (short-subunit alcohol dehydrogenase family)|nr:SDR family oxidoreductase [Solirubrobacteraceae bacterium]
MAPLALVTGASTGIGRATSERLRQLGFHVLAGVRDPTQAPPGTEAIQLDVTSESDIAAAAERVGAELQVLVNNAGVAVSGPVEVVPVEEWRRQLEINLIGQVAVTRALLPAVLRACGHIVNMSSIGGRVTNPLFGPYSASKFGLEAMSDALRREVSQHGVRVVVVEPGGIATPIWDKGHSDADRMLENAPPEAVRRYEHLHATVRRATEKLARDGLPPEAVADVVGRAVTMQNPRPRYVVGRSAKIRAVAARLLPDRAFDALVARYLRR